MIIDKSFCTGNGSGSNFSFGAGFKSPAEEYYEYVLDFYRLSI